MRSLLILLFISIAVHVSSQAWILYPDLDGDGIVSTAIGNSNSHE